MGYRSRRWTKWFAVTVAVLLIVADCGNSISGAAKRKKEKEIMDQILNATVYDKRIRPTGKRDWNNDGIFDVESVRPSASDEEDENAVNDHTNNQRSKRWITQHDSLTRDSVRKQRSESGGVLRQRRNSNVETEDETERHGPLRKRFRVTTVEDDSRSIKEDTRRRRDTDDDVEDETTTADEEDAGNEKDDDDADDDGTPDIIDEDDDNDGIPDKTDKDDDGDGLPDDMDEDADTNGDEDAQSPGQGSSSGRKGRKGKKMGSKEIEEDQPVEVKVDLQLRSISGIDEKKMEYQVQITLRQRWVDERLNYEHLIYVYDKDGDGIPDALDEDDDGDGIPDINDEDNDNDGIPDKEDDDDDGDGIPDADDTDDDNDGIPDILDADDDNDGIPDTLDEDDDGDGIPDEKDRDDDDDNDGIPDFLDDDDDNDGIPDKADKDDDGDGIPDQLEIDYDDDDDGIPDSLDKDDDNDGIPDDDDDDDDGDGVPDERDKDDDDDNDGIPDILDADDDNDGIPDREDEDDDGDGIPDEEEDDMDNDNDGIPDIMDEDDDNDGIPDKTDVDDDGDGVPDEQDVDDDDDNDGIPDILDEDDDNDGVPDSVDLDDDGDGILDEREIDYDDDNDGIPDILDQDDDNDGIPDKEDIDDDGDGIPDEQDKDDDDDNDGIPDVIDEDDDNDGIPDSVDKDDDGDGIPDAEEIDYDDDNDGIPDLIDDDDDNDGIPDKIDTDDDGDGVPDEQDRDDDDDNDGIPDILDDDDDNDGVPDSADKDDDGDGISDEDEIDYDDDDDGIPDRLDNDDDNDGIPDNVDLDDDGDGIPDEEDKDDDDDNDGIPDIMDEDDDNDGIPDIVDKDDDGDGIPDEEEAFAAHTTTTTRAPVRAPVTRRPRKPRERRGIMDPQKHKKLNEVNNRHSRSIQKSDRNKREAEIKKFVNKHIQKVVGRTRLQKRDAATTTPTPKVNKYGITSIIMDRDDYIWSPSLFFPDEMDAKIHKILFKNSLVRIKPSGEVLYSIRVTLTMRCSMDLRMFPFDNQMCRMSIASYDYGVKDLILRWKKDNPVQRDPKIELPRFELVDLTTGVCDSVTVTGNYSCLFVKIFLERQWGYYLVQVYVPCILLVILSWISFWLDPNASPARTALGVTTLLTISTQASGLNARLPPASYIKAIDVWFGVCLLFLFAAFLEFAIVNTLARRESSAQKNAKNIEDGGPEPTPCCSTLYPTVQSRAKKTDMISRIFFPLLFFLFNLIYWSSYVWFASEDGVHVVHNERPPPTYNETAHWTTVSKRGAGSWGRNPPDIVLVDYVDTS